MSITIDSLYRFVQSALPFDWAQSRFMLDALLIVAFLAPLCAALGVKVVNYRMAFFSDAISHSAFTGVVLGYLLIPVFARWFPNVHAWDRILPPTTLVLFGLGVGLGISSVRRRTDLSSDTVIGVFFAAVIALGIAFISRHNLRGDFERFLYGSIVTAGPADVILTAGLAVVVIVYFALSFNRLMLIGLNEPLARSRGIGTMAHEHGFALILALVVTLSIRSVGLLLVTALLVVPAAAARNVARSAGGMVWWSAAFGLVSGVGGLIGSYYADTAAGASMILLATAIFVVSMPIGDWLKRSAGRAA